MVRRYAALVAEGKLCLVPVKIGPKFRHRFIDDARCVATGKSESEKAVCMVRLAPSSRMYFAASLAKSARCRFWCFVMELTSAAGQGELQDARAWCKGGQFDVREGGLANAKPRAIPKPKKVRSQQGQIGSCPTSITRSNF
jgi:hypothetical protein